MGASFLELMLEAEAVFAFRKWMPHAKETAKSPTALPRWVDGEEHAHLPAPVLRQQLLIFVKLKLCVSI